MKKFHLSTLTGITMILISLPLLALLLLAGCQAEPVAQAEAAPSNDAESQAATEGINPADRKFLTGAVAPSIGVGVMANVAPADRNFYTGGYSVGAAVSEEVEALRIDPADRKFFNTVGELPETVHPADRKFFDR